VLEYALAHAPPSVTLSVKLGRRLGAIDVDEELSPIEALRELRIVSQPAREALEAQREVHNSSQRVYVGLTVSVLREAVEQQIQSTASDHEHRVMG
jgi:hypothetical protein